MDIAEHALARADLHAALTEMEHAMTVLRLHIETVDGKLDAYCWNEEAGHRHGADARALAVEVITAWHFADGQAGNTSVKCAGVLLASDETLLVVERAMRAKQGLSKALARTDAIRLAADGNSGNSLTDDVLENTHHNRLHRRQAARQIPVRLDEVIAVSWSFTRNPAQSRVEREELLMTLRERVDDPRAAADLRIVEQLPADAPLVERHRGSITTCANLVVVGDNGRETPRMLRTHLPVLLSDKHSAPHINLVRPPQTELSRRRRRIDAKLTEQPILQTRPIHTWEEFKHW